MLKNRHGRWLQDSNSHLCCTLQHAQRMHRPMKGLANLLFTCVLCKLHITPALSFDSCYMRFERLAM